MQVDLGEDFRLRGQGIDTRLTGALALTAKAGSKDLGLALSAGDKPLAATTIKVEEEECQIEYSRSGQYLLVRVNDRLVLQATVSG